MTTERNAFSWAYLQEVKRRQAHYPKGHLTQTSYTLALFVWLVGPEGQEEIGEILGHLASDDGRQMREEAEALGTLVKQSVPKEPG